MFLNYCNIKCMAIQVNDTQNVKIDEPFLEKKELQKTEKKEGKKS